MPGLDLSSLNAQELRNVLEAARSRNQAELTEEVLSELQTRRSRPPGHFPWRAANYDEVVEQPEAWWEDLRQEAEAPDEPARSKAPMILGITAAVLLSAGVGWWLSPRGQGRVEQPPAMTSLPAPRVMEAYVTPEPPAPPPAAAPQDFNRSVETAAPPLVTRQAASPPAPPQRPIRLAKAEPAVHTPTKAKPAPVEPSPAKASTCKGEPTPADQTVCSSRALTARHQQMREAYERAINAGADPLLIDRDQAEWRIRRNGVSNRETLAKLYDRRIRELNTAAARATMAPST